MVLRLDETGRIRDGNRSLIGHQGAASGHWADAAKVGCGKSVAHSCPDQSLLSELGH